jgi:TIR domain
MADVFLSYASEDRERAHMIADALTARGWTVWWDRQILPGETFESVIERELASADCVLVLWSQHSVQSHWTKAEADEALNRGVLVPALIDEVRIPIAFRHVQAASLIDWTPQATGHAGFRMLEQSIRNLDRPDPLTGGNATPVEPPIGMGAAGSAWTGTGDARVHRSGTGEGGPQRSGTGNGALGRSGSGDGRQAIPAATAGGSTARSGLRAHPRALVGGIVLIGVVGIVAANMGSGDEGTYDEAGAEATVAASAEVVASREQEALDAGYQAIVEWADHEVVVGEATTFLIDAQPGLDYWAMGSTTSDCALTIHFDDAAREDATDPDDFGFIVEDPMTVSVALTVQSESSATCTVGAGIYVRKAVAGS